MQIISETEPALVTEDKDELIQRMHRIHVKSDSGYGVKDCPANTLSAISAALNFALPNSYLYIFTDSIAKDLEYEATVIDSIQRKQATVCIFL